jgi:hypothetical protein
LPQAAKAKIAVTSTSVNTNNFFISCFPFLNGISVNTDLYYALHAKSVEKANINTVLK